MIDLRTLRRQKHMGRQIAVEALEPRQMLAADVAIGDANMDGVFDQDDLVQVLDTAKYLSGEPASVSEGDFDCDGQFDQFDLIAALQRGSYEPAGQQRTGQGAQPLREGEARTVAAFDATNSELPEGVAVDKVGNLFVTLAPRGEVWRIAPDGSRALFAEFAMSPESPLPGALGLAVDAPGNVYAALATADPTSHGVWRVSRDGQTKERLPGTEVISFPNALTLDHEGNVYVTDSLQGSVWRIPSGGSAELWTQDTLLEPNLELSPVGANGISFRQNALLVANSSRFSIVSISIERDGTAGEAEVFFQGELGFVPDGIAMDVHGNVYVANPISGVVQRLSADDMSLTVIATDVQGLDDPTSLAFGSGKGSRQSVFVANSTFFGMDIGASVVEIGVGASGLPLP